MSDQNPLNITLYYIVPHPTQPKIVLVSDGDSWRLPQVTQIDLEQHHRFAYYEHGMMVQSVDDIPISALNLLAYQVDHKRNIFVTENITALHDLPQEMQWATEQEAISQLSDEALNPLLEQYFEEQRTNETSPLRAAWTFNGWRAANHQWIADQLAQHDLQLIGEIELIRKWCLSVIKKVPTNEGDLYFKTAATVFGREVALTQDLAQIVPANLPTIFAADTNRNFMLMRDMGGKQLRKQLGEEHLHLSIDAAQKYAELQKATIDQKQHFFDLGAQDYRLETLYQRFEAYILDDDLMQADDRLSIEDIQALRSNLPVFKERIETLQNHNIPATVIHCDLHVGNIQVSDDAQPIFYDWTDMSIGHPFFDMTTFMWGIQDIFQNDETHINQIRDAYLTPFTDDAPLEALHDALKIGINLGLIVQVLNYHHLLQNLEPQVRWSLDFRTTFLKSLADSVLE